MQPNQELENINQRLAALEQGIHRIESYLYDDNSTSSPGMVQRVRNHDKRIGELEEEKRTQKKIFVWLGLIGGSLSGIIFQLIQWYITKK